MWLKPDFISMTIQINERQSILNQYPRSIDGLMHIARDIKTWIAAGVHPDRFDVQDGGGEWQWAISA